MVRIDAQSFCRLAEFQIRTWSWSKTRLEDWKRASRTMWRTDNLVNRHSVVYDWPSCRLNASRVEPRHSEFIQDNIRTFRRRWTVYKFWHLTWHLRRSDPFTGRFTFDKYTADPGKVKVWCTEWCFMFELPGCCTLDPETLQQIWPLKSLDASPFFCDMVLFEKFHLGPRVFKLLKSLEAKLRSSPSLWLSSRINFLDLKS